MIPPMRNDTQTAAPAIVPASPNRAKIPAPTMAPMPMKMAPRSVRVPLLELLSAPLGFSSKMHLHPRLTAIRWWARVTTAPTTESDSTKITLARTASQWRQRYSASP